MAKRKAEEIAEVDHGSLSAFAALKPVHTLAAKPLPVEGAVETSEPIKKIKFQQNAEPGRPMPPTGDCSSSNPFGKTIEPLPTDIQGYAGASPEASKPTGSEVIEDGSNDGYYRSSSDSDDLISSEHGIQILSNFDLIIENVLDETNYTWTVRLLDTDTITLVGQYDLWVRWGAIEVLGATIRSSAQIYRIYSPATHALLPISVSKDPRKPVDQPAEIAIISSSSRIRMLRFLSPKFRRIWNRTQALKEGPSSGVDSAEKSFSFLKSSADDTYKRPLQVLQPPDSWMKLLPWFQTKQSISPVSMMVCGPKGSGKSTFCRFMANCLLSVGEGDAQGRVSQSVMFLDLDPGQPELSAPGEISLIHMKSFNLGVPYTHPMINPSEGNRVLRAHFIGAHSPKYDPDHYLRCAFDLLNYYQLVFSRYSLIVNCSGWIQGGGLEVLAAIILHGNVKVVKYMSREGPIEVEEGLHEAARKAHVAFSTLDSRPPGILTRTASDLRMMQTMSYFHLDQPEGDHLRWNPSPINEMEPLIVRYAGVAQDIFAIMILGEAQDPENFSLILEGSIVGLVAIEDDSAISIIEEEVQSDANMEPDKTQTSVVEVPDTLQPCTEPYHTQSTQLPKDIDPGQADALVIYKILHPEENSSLPATNYLSHPSILRNRDKIPYLPPTAGTRAPLCPARSHSLGQAIIRAIDPTTQTIHLTTPIPPSTLSALHAQRTKIVLVRGSQLDPPTWAKEEELVRGAARRRRRAKVHGDADRFGAEEKRAWAQDVPFAKVVDGTERKSSGGRVRRVRSGFKAKGGDKRD